VQLGNVDFVVNPEVYPPSDDTYLLLDAIKVNDSDIFMEVGCGSGLITLAAAKACSQVFATDVSLTAVRNTVQNLRRNALISRCSVIQTDILSSFAPVAHFSVIVFNPPYLPQDDITTGMDHAFVGGPSGAETTERFIREGVNHLRENGRLYVVTSSLADMGQIKNTMEGCSLNTRVVASSRFFFETLSILEGTAVKGRTETVL
jgi:release factor glutamine methyltransferase